MILDDLRRFRDHLPQLADCPGPENNFAFWRELTKFRGPWKQLVALYRTSASSHSPTKSSEGAIDLFKCLHCDDAFPTSKARDMHMRIRHGVRCEWRKFIGKDNACPHCAVVFSTRLRAIAHLNDPRRNIACREAVQSGKHKAISDKLLAEYDEQDRITRKEAFKAGRSPLSKGLPRAR